jgi:hypothetical protein
MIVFVDNEEIVRAVASHHSWLERIVVERGSAIPASAAASSPKCSIFREERRKTDRAQRVRNPTLQPDRFQYCGPLRILRRRKRHIVTTPHQLRDLEVPTAAAIPPELFTTDWPAADAIR